MRQGTTEKKYWNGQKYCECQLISLWNAAIFHGLYVPERYGKRYVADCEEARAICGGAINTSHVIHATGLRWVKGKLNFHWVRAHLPVEFHLLCHRGNHSVLCVDTNAEKGSLLLANYAKTRLQWVPFQRAVLMQRKRVVLMQWIPWGGYD